MSAERCRGRPKNFLFNTPRCRRGHYSFSCFTPPTFDLYLIMLSVKQGGIKYHFLSLWYDSTRD